MKTGNVSSYYPGYRSKHMIRRRGFTLIEAVVSLAIVVVVLTTLFRGSAIWPGAPKWICQQWIGI
ncbi:prepilin-type N-terminal cleavage/methylation domain-containing protein [Lactiplantibacillus plantarum]